MCQALKACYLDSSRQFHEVDDGETEKEPLAPSSHTW